MTRVDYYFDPPLIESFHIFNLGHEYCLPGHQFGPHVREHFVIHYVIKGQGFFEKSGVRYELGAGQFFLIKPGEVTFYRADEVEPWEYFWLGFNGGQTEDLLSLLGLLDYNRVGTVKDQGKLTSWITEALDASVTIDTNSFYIQGLSQAIFGEFQVEGNSTYQTINRRNVHIEKLLNAIHNNFGRTDYSIQELARTLNLTAPYLTSLTKKELGKNPSQLLSDYRLEKAHYLLKKTDMRVNEVAIAVGYESPLSFSRAYKKMYGLAPSFHQS
ncbi:AraC family transcriptional regulator [Vagococcus sp. BWB3-3]|uniref:AraC family transcriptional regulator n=1 Tax=Vagococcus allomyrinae TaxID=2794353 RepID=A0A940P981_9ENTE|nr:AraC family transcriptional regulator [Vagococcus allomyrinae]MBP1044074.1 AraC family transcriptional regulator [Vagococcus allomyrinae]